MRKLLFLLEGLLGGCVLGGFVLIIGNMVSGTTTGIIVTLVACAVFGATVSRVSGFLAGLVVGGIVVLSGNLVSQSVLGMVATLASFAVLGVSIAAERWACIVRRAQPIPGPAADLPVASDTSYDWFVTHHHDTGKLERSALRIRF